MLQDFVKFLLSQQALQAVLSNGLKEVHTLLPGPTLVYHDGSGDLDIIVEKMEDVVLFQHPHDLNSLEVVPKSTVLVARQSKLKEMLLALREYPIWEARNPMLVIQGTSDSVKETLKILWETARVVNVMVVTIRGPTAQFFTWFPYRPKECDQVLTITKLNTSSFHDKITGNISKCLLQAVVTQFPPMVINDYHGVEIKIFQDLAKKINADARIVHLPPGQVIYRLFDAAGKRTFGNKLLWENKVDLMFGTTGPSPNVSSPECLRSHTIDDMVWFVPGAVPRSRLDSIYKALPSTIWWLIFATCLLLYAVDFLTQIFFPTARREIFLPFLAINLNLSSKPPANQTLKFLMIVAYFYSLHITTAYQSSLIMLLSTVPRTKEIKTWKELAESDLGTMLHEKHKGMVSQSLLAALTLLETPERTTYVSYLHIEEAASPSKTAILGPKIGFSIITKGSEFYDEYGYPRVHMIKRTAYTKNLAFFISNGHPLQPILDQYTEWIIEAGLPQQYIAQLTPTAKSIITKLKPLNVDTIFGPLLLLLGLLVISCLTFVAEVLYFRTFKYMRRCPLGWLRVRKDQLGKNEGRSQRFAECVQTEN